MHEAKLQQTEHGVVPADDGWFVVNLDEIAWDTVEGGGTWCAFEAPGTEARNPVGVGVHVLPPGESSGFYHRESEQEGFLVLRGEALVVVEGQERRLRQWDYFHCPPDTAHILLGAGEQGAAILMLGTRREGHTIHYPADPVAGRHGASVSESTDSPSEAYRDRPPIRPARPPAPWG